VSDDQDTLPDGETGKVEDFPETRLALRVWRYEPHSLTLRSVNAGGRVSTPSWISAAMASPVGGWPHREPLEAQCAKGHDHEEGHPVIAPAEECSCGIYATTDLEVVHTYLWPDTPVLGIVELGGKTFEAARGYRAQYATVAAILLIDPRFTAPHDMLRRLAEAYNVPTLVPHSADPEEYRDRLHLPLADEVERFLREQGGGTP
jgi:hypothetical protein